MNISFCVFRWLNLYDKIHAGDIKTTRCNISSDQYAKFLFFKALKGDLTLVLSNITVHNLNVFLNLFA